jgi:CDP-diacylglycerol--glycerol-3-phosphate 3-phosphatidyltransferase
MAFKKHLPNVLSQSRIPLGVLFFFLFTRDRPLTTAFCLLLIIISLITDYLDGMLARKNNTVTLLGKWIDPFSDFVFFLFVYLSFYRTGIMPLLLFCLFLLRELSMYTLIRPLYMRYRLDPAAKLPGKIKTVFQISGSILLIGLFYLQQLQILSFAVLQTWGRFVLGLLIALSLASLYWYIKPLVIHLRQGSPS